jgi:RHS repeat-associated protein
VRAVLIPLVITLRGFSAQIENLFDTAEDCVLEGVHLLTGQYVHRESYLSLPGPEPFRVGHSFQPGWEAKMGGWNILPQSRLEVVRYGSSPGRLRMFAADTRGHVHVWRWNRSCWKPELGSSAVLPADPSAARLNPDQESIHWKPKADQERVVQRLAHGGQRVYRLKGHQKAEGWTRVLSDEEAPTETWLYLLEQERLSSGNILQCAHDDTGLLSRVEILDRAGRSMSALTCSATVRGEKDLDLQLTLPDERKVLFQLHDFRGIVAGRPQADLMLPIKVSGDEIIPQEWSYRADLLPWTTRVFGSGDLYQISGIQTVRRPDGRVVHMTLDEQQRVSSLQKSTGDQGELETVYRFSYGEESQSCWTEVKASDGGVQRVEFDADRLLRRMSWSDPRGTCQRQIRWTWSKHRPARLLRKELCDGAGRLLSTSDYAYDGLGRVIAHHRSGRLQAVACEEVDRGLTGPSDDDRGSAARSAALRASLERVLQGPQKLPMQVQTTQWTYNSQNLVVRQVQSDGATLTFEYLPGTDRKSAEYAWLDGRIVRRAFFRYDEAGQLIEEIRDDGSGLGPNELTEVHLRQRSTRQLRSELPGLCLPERVEEWGGLPGQEVLKRVTSTAYTLGERPSHQQVWDPATNQTVQQHWGYHQGRVVYHRDAVGAERRYRYDHNGNCIEQVGPRAQEWVHTVFDRRNRRISQSTSDGRQVLQQGWVYDALDRIVSHKLPWGAQSSFTYNIFGHLISQHSPDPVTGQPLRAPSMTCKWDAQGALVESCEWDGTRWETTQWARGLDGLPLVCQHPDGTLEAWSYDDQLRPVWMRNRHGQECWTRLDGLGHPLSQTTRAGTSTHRWTGDLLLATTDALGEQTLYLYDPFGRVRETCRAGLSTHTQHDAWGRVLVQQTGDRVVTWEYDGLGRRTRQTEGTGDQVQSTSSWRYGVVGDWLEARQEGLTPTVIRRDFDLQGRLLATQDALGATTRYHWTLSPDATHSWRCVEQLPDGRTLTRLFDHREGLRTVSCTKDSKSLWQEQHRLDGLQRTVEVTLQEGETALLTRQQRLAPGGKTIQLVELPLGAKTCWHYDADGRLTSVDRPHGETIHLDYDAVGRLARRFSSDGSICESWRYDPLGRVLEADSAIGLQVRRWDPHGRLLEEQLPGIGRWTMVHGPAGELLRWESLGSSQDWTWQGFRPMQVALSSPSASEQVGCQDHDVTHRPLTWGPPRALQKLEVDPLLRPKRVKGPFFEEAITATTPDGRWLEGTWNQPRIGQRGLTALRWSYDEASHLIGETGFRTSAWTVNALHARRTSAGEPVELLAHSLPVTQNGLQCRWDLNGRCVQLGSEGSSWRLEWDALDRLRRACQQDREILFEYDVWGRLVRRTEGANVATFLYCGEKMVAVYTSAGTWVRACLPSLVSETGATVALHSPQGSETTQHDLQGSLLLPDTCPYNAWGVSEVPARPWGYRGKWHDPALDCVWMGKRWYCPELGVFLSRDPLGVPDGLSTHAYLRHGPLGLFDAWGCELQIHPMESFGSPNPTPDCSSLRGTPSSEHWLGLSDEFSLMDRAIGSFWGSNVNSLRMPSHYVLRKDATNGEDQTSIVHIFAPGVDTPLDVARGYVNSIADQSGGHAVFLPWRRDSSMCRNLWQIRTDLQSTSTERLDDCRELARHLVAQHANQKLRPIFSVIGHSAGVRSLQVFAEEMKTLGWGDSVIAIGLGGATTIAPKGLLSADNVAHHRDPVPHISGSSTIQLVRMVGEKGSFDLAYHAYLGSEYQGAVSEHIKRVQEAAASRFGQEEP